MSQSTGLKIAVFWVLAAVIWACAGGAGYRRLPVKHDSMDGEDLRSCLDCHDEEDGDFPYRRFVHNAFFAESHRHAANRNQRVCAMCHPGSDCEACHGVGVELKPSLKNQTGTARRMPHRGDYLSRHRIDGRLDPFSCLRCHGNPKTARTCRACHG